MRHEIPTHLGTEDTILLGMTMRQVLLLALGATFGYGFWLRLAHLALLVRWPCAILPAVLALAFALICPAGRPLESWLAAMIRYACLPKTCVWRRRREGGTDDSN
jgi:PrgI family protein